MEDCPKCKDIDECIRRELKLCDKLGKYRGRWVAIHKHKVAFSAPTLEDLRLKMKGKRVSGGVMKIAEKDYFYG